MTVVLIGDILVGNTDGGGLADDLAGLAADPSNHNLVGADATNSLTNGVNGNQLGATVAQVGLAPLGNYGGPTATTSRCPGAVPGCWRHRDRADLYQRRRPAGWSTYRSRSRRGLPGRLPSRGYPAKLQHRRNAGRPGGHPQRQFRRPQNERTAHRDDRLERRVRRRDAGPGRRGVYFQRGTQLRGGKAYFPTVLIANADGQTAAGAEEQILPAAFLVVLDLKGEPGQTVSGAVTDPVSGDVIQASFTVSLADVGVAEFLAAQLVNVKLPTLPGLIEFAGIYDFREHNLGLQDSVPVTLVIRDSLALFEAPVLLYLDPRTNQEHIFKGNVLFTREPDILIVSITFDNASTPRLVDLTTTVFTVAIGVPGAAVTTASALVASADATATAPVQTATFQSSSQLSLTLATTQLGQVSQSLSSLSGGGEADGDSPNTDDGLARLVAKELEALRRSGARPPSGSCGAPAPESRPVRCAEHGASPADAGCAEGKAAAAGMRRRIVPSNVRPSRRLKRIAKLRKPRRRPPSSWRPR